jgi:hypothetical protein
MFPAHAYHIRYATFGDEPALRRLMELNRQRIFGGPALIGEIEGAVAAVASLSGGRVLVDPFQDTKTLKELLLVRRQAMRN